MKKMTSHIFQSVFIILVPRKIKTFLVFFHFYISCFYMKKTQNAKSA